MLRFGAFAVVCATLLLACARGGPDIDDVAVEVCDRLGAASALDAPDVLAAAFEEAPSRGLTEQALRSLLEVACSELLQRAETQFFGEIAGPVPN